MTTFQDGPAKGQVLNLKRAPRFLRVTRSAVSGEWDALDLLDDRPTAVECLFAYELIGEAGHCFMEGRDKAGRRGGAFYSFATYRFVDPQPDDADMRDQARWEHWCLEAA